MVRLSLRLALRSGREGLLRLLITAAAVAAGIACGTSLMAVLTLTPPLLRTMTAPATIRFE